MSLNESLFYTLDERRSRRRRRRWQDKQQQCQPKHTLTEGAKADTLENI